MPVGYTKPTPGAIRKALLRYAPQLAARPVEYFDEGWDCWAFSAGDYVLRFPKAEDVIVTLEKERRLLPALAPRLSLPVPRIDVYGESGPNCAPFVGHRRLPGVLVTTSDRHPAPSFGSAFGCLLRELHAFPVEEALGLGVPRDDGATLREARIGQYEQVIRRVFPLVSCEARTVIESRYEANLNNSANFDYEPRLIHRDLDSNTLIDPETGDLCGVIDFGDAVVGNRAFDLWLAVFGFRRLGIEVQTGECLAEAGVSSKELSRIMPELEFIDFRWPLLDILHGLDVGDESYVEGGIRDLNASLAPETPCL